MNAVNARTGNKFSQSKAEMFRFREYVNQVLEAYGLRPIGKQTEPMDVMVEKYFSDEDDWNDEDFSMWTFDCEEIDSKTRIFEIDPDECEELKVVEAFDELESQVINFFESGNSNSEDELFENINFGQAKEMYSAWKDACDYEDDSVW